MPSPTASTIRLLFVNSLTFVLINSPNNIFKKEQTRMSKSSEKQNPLQKRKRQESENRDRNIRQKTIPKQCYQLIIEHGKALLQHFESSLKST